MSKNSLYYKKAKERDEVYDMKVQEMKMKISSLPPSLRLKVENEVKIKVEKLEIERDLSRVYAVIDMVC